MSSVLPNMSNVEAESNESNVPKDAEFKRTVNLTKAQSKFIKTRAGEGWDKRIQTPIGTWLNDLHDEDEMSNIVCSVFSEKDRCGICDKWIREFNRQSFYCEWSESLGYALGEEDPDAYLLRYCFNEQGFLKTLNGFMRHVKEHDGGALYKEKPRRDMTNEIRFNEKTIKFLHNYSLYWFDIMTNNKLENLIEHHGTGIIYRFMQNAHNWNHCKVCEKVHDMLYKALEKTDDFCECRTDVRPRAWAKALEILADHFETSNSHTPRMVLCSIIPRYVDA